MAKRRAADALRRRLEQLHHGLGAPCANPAETIAIIEKTLFLMAKTHRATQGQLKLASDIGVFRCTVCGAPALRVNGLRGRCEQHRGRMRDAALLGRSHRDAAFDAQHPKQLVSHDHSGHGIEYVRGSGVIRAARLAR